MELRHKQHNGTNLGLPVRLKALLSFLCFFLGVHHKFAIRLTSCSCKHLLLLVEG